MCTNFSTNNHRHLRWFLLTAGLILLVLTLILPEVAAAKTVTADVVLLDHVLVFNRLGAQNVNGMIYALKRDVVPVNENGDITGPPGQGLQAGLIKLRPDKRPRPIVLRVSAGDTLVVNFTNLLNPAPAK